MNNRVLNDTNYTINEDTTIERRGRDMWEKWLRSCAANDVTDIVTDIHACVAQCSRSQLPY